VALPRVARCRREPLRRRGRCSTPTPTPTPTPAAGKGTVRSPARRTIAR
jgi:hypothetical protein